MKSYDTEPRDGMISEVSEQGETLEVEQTNGFSEVTYDQEAEVVDLPEEEQEPDGHSLVVMGRSERADAPDEPQSEEELPGRKGFIRPTREKIVLWASFSGVVLLGAILRFWGLGDKPLHHDESLHAYFSMILMHEFENLSQFFGPNPPPGYRYDPLLHGPFQFHAIALTYKISQLLGAPDNGINTFTVRIPAATLGSLLVGFPYFLRDYLGKIGAWIACFLLAVSPSTVYFSRFAREDIYMACFTLLMVVAVARYVRDRKMYWLVIAAAAFSLSYATKEATFLSVAVFGSFLGGLLVWELGLRWETRYAKTNTPRPFYAPRTAAPITLLAYILVGGLAARSFFNWLKALSIYVTDPKNTQASDQFVQNLKDTTVAIVPWLGILLGIFVLSILGREMFGVPRAPGRRGLAKLVDPQKQRLMDVIVSMPWTHWFFALLVGWAIFILLFTVLFTNIKDGIGSGIWQGLYYWLQQQQVARGGQPWYYYLILIPLYEQIGVVFGIVGVVYCLIRPTRFRLFMVYWFVGNVVIYSWASEKMPWLMIHMTIPMFILAAIGLQPAVVTIVNLVKNRFTRGTDLSGPQADLSHPDLSSPASRPLPAPQPRPRVGVLGGASAVFGLVMAVLLLLPTLHNMYEVTYVHPADGPHEMMVYVQTTTDVNIVMQKIAQLDQKLYGGTHQLPIGIMNDAVWPFVWYVRDYPNICLNYPDGCSTTASSYPVIISGGDNLYNAINQYSDNNGKTGPYLMHQYHMRTWWDEGYKPPPCVPTPADSCAGQPSWGGVGPGLWLSYGDNPPPGAKFNLGLTVQRIWNWWWYRQPFGDTGGSYDMGLFIQKGLGVTP